MNIAESFANYLATQLSLTLGDDLYIGGVPVEAPDECWWLVAGGGGSITKHATGEKQKNYIVTVYHRAFSAKTVLDNLQALEVIINSGQCTQLDGYNTVEMEATIFPTDQDIDNQELTIGLVQIAITTYL